MKRILLPTDFSENARTAAEYAIEMFHNERVEFHLLNTYTIPYSAENVLVFVDELLQKESKRALSKERDFLLKKYQLQSSEIKKKSAYGELSLVVNEFVDKHKIDFVVMGTKGASGLKKILIGSNTTDVLRKVDRPILIVPENSKYQPLDIALAIDFEKVNYDKTLSPLKEILQTKKLNLSVVNIHKKEELEKLESENIETKLKNTFKGLSLKFNYLEKEKIVDGLNEFILNKQINMLAMISHQYGLIKKLFHNSVTNSMSMLTKTPLLILKDKLED